MSPNDPRKDKRERNEHSCIVILPYLQGGSVGGGCHEIFP